MTRFETANGSRYELDEVAGTWHRRKPGLLANPDAPMRTEEGIMTGHSAIVVGQPVLIWGPSLTPGLDRRQIETSPVARILDEATN